MAFSQADLDAIDEAITSGALTVKYADKEVTYRSLKDLERIKALIKADILGTPKISHTTGIYFKRH